MNMNMEKVITAAAGREPVDTLFINGRVIDVFTGEILEKSIGVKAGYICGFGDYEAVETVDLEGMYLAPGFMDAHVHIESAMVTPLQFSRGVLPYGTTTVIADPHEIANVMGIAGIEYMIASAEKALMNILFALPSCVPATHMETSGATLNAETIAPLFLHERIIALAEMMNYPGVIFTDPDVMAKIKAAHDVRKAVDGHAPGVKGFDLNAYAAAGIASDHECTTAEEAMEKMRLGIHIMVREGTCAKNLEALCPAITDYSWHQMMWCTDDRHPEEILTQGHVDHIIRKAIASGIDPIRAIQMGTINCARYFGIQDAGAIAPGRRGDMVAFNDLNHPIIGKVFVKGQLVAEKGNLVSHGRQFNGTIVVENGNRKFNGVYPETAGTSETPECMAFDLDAMDFIIKVPESVRIEAERVRVRAIEVIPNQVVTREKIVDLIVSGGELLSDSSSDLIKMAVIERYTGRTGMFTGLVTGLGLTGGAVASSVAHDSHNIIVAGVNDQEMRSAVQAVKTMGGGFAVVRNGEVVASLPLPVAGLMSDEPMDRLDHAMGKVIEAAHDLGSPLADPFMALGFLALPVIPKLKMTDKGLVDVERFDTVPLFV